MKNLLITGSTGFIGTALVEEAIVRGYKVFAAVRPVSNLSHLKKLPVVFVPVNYSSTNEMKISLEKAGVQFDYIIHNAGVIKASKAGYDLVNYQYTKHFYIALSQLGILPERFIYISSLAAYGPGEILTLKPISRTDIPKPITAYGESKLNSERFLTNSGQIPYIIIRPTAVYGPGEKDIFTFFKLISQGLELYIGAHKQYLSFIYIKDLVEAIFKAMESDIKNTSYFVTDGNVYDQRTLGKLIKDKLAKKTLRISIPGSVAKVIAYVMELSQKPFGKVPPLNPEKLREIISVNWTCETEPIRKELGFTPTYDLKQGISETIDWYKQKGWL